MKPATFSAAHIKERSSEIEFELLCALAKSPDNDPEVKDMIEEWYDNVGSVLMHAHGVPTQDELERANGVINELWEELERISKAKKAKLTVE